MLAPTGAFSILPRRKTFFRPTNGATTATTSPAGTICTLLAFVINSRSASLPGHIGMSPSVWTITGFKVETYDDACQTKVRPDRIVGRLHDTTKTIMHGATYLGEGKPTGYTYLKVSLQTIRDFEKLPLSERGLGAVSGGLISSANIPFKGNFTRTQEWGFIDTSKAHILCAFYDSQGTMYHHAVACFDPTNAAPVSGFWRNGNVMIGPDIQCDKTDWGVNFKSSPDAGNCALVLEKVESTIVLKVDFPELSEASAVKTVEPEVMFSEVFTNGSSATMKDTFNMKTTLEDTYTFVFEEGLGVDSSAGWKANVPLLSEEKITVRVEASFEPHQSKSTSKTRTVDRSAEITLPPMVGCKATARYTKCVMAVNAVLTVQKTYTNGAVQTYQVPAKYTGVSCDNAEIKLEGDPVVPASV